MWVEADDTVFVRAARDDVHAYVRDVAGYGSWWPGARSRPVPGGASLELRVPGRRRGGRLRLRAHVAKERPGLGVLLSVRGDLAGTAEWYYLDEPDGTLVHHLVRAEAGGRVARRRLARHRACVRAALLALKDLLESGRPPGAEPETALLEAQARAAEEFDAGVQAREETLDVSGDDAV